MERRQKARKPAINVYTDTTVTGSQLNEVLRGIEEEGVPCLVEVRDENNPLRLASTASQDSTLAVGVGVASGYVVIGHEKLPENQPYLASRFNESADSDRLIGGNAARIVKRIPLKL